VVIPFILARKIETMYWKHHDKELNKKVNENFQDLPNISESSKAALNTRGGVIPNPFWSYLIKLVLTDFGVKVAIGGAVGASVWNESADLASAQLVKYGSAILAAPGKKFFRLLKRIKGINPEHSQAIKEILLDKDLTNEEKLELLKIKIESVLKNLRGSKRNQFFLACIAMIAFCIGNNFVLFAWFMERLQALIGTGDDVDSIRQHIIEVYQEYNAPLPRELVENLPEEIIQSIKNLN
jgi:hypothetical protein